MRTARRRCAGANAPQRAARERRTTCEPARLALTPRELAQLPMSSLPRDIFLPHGANPLAACGTVGELKRVPDKQNGFVLEFVEDSPPARLTIPRPGAEPLNLRHRYVVVEVFTWPDKPLGIELTVKTTDMSSDLERTLILATGCMTPEFARGGGAKAKLPLQAQHPPGAEVTGSYIEACWKLAIIDLDVLIRRAFDGAPYTRLDSVSLVGVCKVASIRAMTFPPPVQPPGPVRLIAIYNPPGALPPAPDAGEAEKIDLEPSDDPESYPGRTPDERKERMAEAKAARAAVLAVEGAKAAEREFLMKAIAKRPPVSEDAQGFIPAGAEGFLPAAPPSEAVPRWQSAVRKLGMANRLGARAGRYPRRDGDPRNHMTNGDFHWGHDADVTDASIFKKVTYTTTGTVADETMTKRSGVASAQELARKLRWGIAGEVADLTGVQIGEVGARLLSFTLPKARSLIELRLPSTGIGDGGVSYLCTALRTMTTLRHVDLRQCDIREKGGIALGGAVEVGCVGIEVLLLGSNPLGPSGVAAIAMALPRNASLVRLDLERTGGGQGLLPLFVVGDRVQFGEPPPPPPPKEDGTAAEKPPAYVVHQRTGRHVQRADAGKDAAALANQQSTLISFGARFEAGLLLDLGKCSKPPRKGVMLNNPPTNAAIEALGITLAQPLISLQHLHLGGNFSGPTQKYLKGVKNGGINRNRLQVLFDGAGDAAAAAEAASLALKEEMRAIAEGVERPTDEAIAIAGLSKLWVPGRPGTLPPEPSFAELDTTEDLGATGDRLETLSGKLGDDDAFDFDDGDFYDPLLDQTIEKMASSPGTFKLEKSQKMSLGQSIAFSMSGAQVSAMAKPPVGGF